MTKVVVGLSGGVDSSVAAYLLKEQGYDVVGLFMKNWGDTEGLISEDCPWREDRIDAMKVASKLGIPFKTVDLVKEYKERIVDYMFREYEQGRTPNPDILCNREIKFDVFLEKALALGADYVATGHYCRRSEVRGQRSESLEVRSAKSEILNDNNSSPKPQALMHRLLAGKDTNKDQSYFLCQVNQKQLSKALFPIGELLKPEVREIAAKIGLNTATKKDSQGLCFIGKVDLPKFLQQKLKAKKGDIIEISKDFYEKSEVRGQRSEMNENISPHVSCLRPSNGHKVGTHNGAHFFTIGQRKGLDVGGTEKPLFVLATDVKQNIVYVGQGTDHPGLFRNELFIKNNDIHWIRTDLKMKEGEEKEFSVRVRYRQPLQKALLNLESKGLRIIFEEPQRAIAAGQFAAWYDGEELIGSGVIC